MKKFKFLYILFILILFVLLIWKSNRNVNNYWNEQEEITCADSINITIEKTGYNRGYLSFNHKYYIFDANVVKSNLELWEATQIKRPFTINKSGSSDTLWLLTKDTNYFFVLEE